MSSKFNIQINVDLKDVAPETEGQFNPDIAAAIFVDLLVKAARRQMKSELHEIKNSTDIKDSDVKAIKMAEKLRGIMLGIMAEANMTVTELPGDTIINTDLPFERKDRDGEAA